MTALRPIQRQVILNRQHGNEIVRLRTYTSQDRTPQGPKNAFKRRQREELPGHVIAVVGFIEGEPHGDSLVGPQVGCPGS